MQLDRPLSSGSVILYHALDQHWLWFDQPYQVLTTNQLTEVESILMAIEQAVDQGAYAAGFLSYEAGPAFDPVMQVQPHGAFPLVWLGLYAQPQVITFDQILAQSTHYQLSPWHHSIDPDQFQQAIAQIKDHIAQGHTFQVNYSYRLQATFTGDPLALFTDLVSAQTAGYSAYVNTGRWIICSASPELFVSRTGSGLIMKPMKGTTARGLDSTQDRYQANWLHQSPKNRAENVMIVDMVRHDLGQIAQVGSVQVPQLFDPEQYPTLWQMTSTVTATTSAPLHRVLGCLFPAASITGAPKIRTMQIIRDLETSPRRIYTGSIGFITPDQQAQFNVAIRTVLIDTQTQTAEYGVGSGIVWDSDPEAEYQECLLKTQVLSYQRPHFSLLETIRWLPDQGYFLLSEHLERLMASARYFNIQINGSFIQDQLQHLATTLPASPQKVRLLLDQTGTLQFESQAIIPHRYPLRVKLALEPIHRSNLFLYHKTTHRQIYDQARAQHPDCDDVLLWNDRGEVTESCTANLVIRQATTWVTPPVACGLLAGTFRSHLLQHHRIQEAVITLEHLQQAQEIYLINSIREWQSVILVT